MSPESTSANPHPRADVLQPSRMRPVAFEAGVAAGLFLIYLFSFGDRSPVHNSEMLFGQDGWSILRNLADDRPYPWNPQTHLLYHVLLESGGIRPGSRSPRSPWPWAAHNLFAFYLPLR